MCVNVGWVRVSIVYCRVLIIVYCVLVYRLSVTGYRLSLNACWLSVVGRCRSLVSYRLPVSRIDCRLSLIARWYRLLRGARRSLGVACYSCFPYRSCLLHAVPVEAADLVSLTPPWDARGGKRELLFISPTGLARYWPDLYSPRRFTDVDARSVAPGQSVRAGWGFGSGVEVGGEEGR